MPSTSSSGAASANAASDILVSDILASDMAGHHVLVAEIGALDLVVPADRIRHAGGNDAAIDEDADAVGERKHRLHVFPHQQDRTFAAKTAEQLAHASRFSGAEPRHRLVQQQ